ncbi:MAG: head GIN domain-containing protein [Spirochaetia bacterium]
MNHTARAAILSGALFLAAAGCFALGAREIEGSGVVARESRTVAAFTGIVIEGSGNVTLSQGSAQSLSVETDDNLMPQVKTEVRGGVLYLGFKQGAKLLHVSQLEFLVTVPKLTGVKISGSGNLHTTSLIRAEALSLEISGSGGIYSELDVGRLGVAVSGSGGITAEGKAEHISVVISGSGSVQAHDLVSGTAEVSVNGSGEAVINARRAISINVSGSGRVAYGGGAEATITKSGSGVVQRF